MGSQFRSRYVFKLLVSTVLPEKTLSWYYNERHNGKRPIDGIRKTVKNAVFRNVKSGLLVVCSPLEFFKAMTKFVQSILSIYLRGNENFIEPEYIKRSIKCWNYISRNKNVVSMTIIISIFSKLSMMKILFTCSGMGARMKLCVTMLKLVESDDECAKSHVSYSDGEEWLCCSLCHQSYHEDCFYK